MRLMLFCMAIFCGALLIAYQAQTYSFAPEFQSFGILSWPKAEGCSVQGVPEHLYGPGQAIGSFEPQPKDGSVDCESAAFVLQTPLVAIEYAAAPYAITDPNPDGFLLELVTLHKDEHAAGASESTGSIVASITVPEQKPGDQHSLWQYALLTAPHELAGAKVILRVHGTAKARSQGWFALRQRYTFNQELPGWEAALKALGSSTRSFSFLIVLAAALVVTTYLLTRCTRQLFVWFCFFFLVALCVHLRFDPYLYFDEWHVLERFSKMGPHGIIYTHNEHFLPLFFGIYYLEAALFGDWYCGFLLVSIALHAVNAVLLSTLLTRLISSADRTSDDAARMSAGFATLLFLVNGLHSEAMQWAFEQCILLAQVVTLCALHWGTSFVERRNGHYFGKILICIVLAPLLFGNGYNLLIQLAALLVFHSVFVHGDRIPDAFRQPFMTRALPLLACGALVSLIPGYLYLSHPEGAGHAATEARPFAFPLAVGNYAFVGSQLGSILRGLGLYPALDADAAPGLLQALAPYGIPQRLYPERAFAYAGFLISLCCCCWNFFFTRSQKSIRLWLLAQALVVAAIILPAFGRYHLGPQQALSLRYHYGAMTGVCLLLLLVIHPIIATSSKSIRLIGKPIVLSLLSVLIALHLRLSLGFDYFIRQGIVDRRFVQQFPDWRSKISDPNKSFDGQDTPLFGQAPTFPHTITPGRLPNDLYPVLTWLNPTKYPASTP